MSVLVNSFTKQWIATVDFCHTYSVYGMEHVYTLVPTCMWQSGQSFYIELRVNSHFKYYWYVSLFHHNIYHLLKKNFLILRLRHLDPSLYTPEGSCAPPKDRASRTGHEPQPMVWEVDNILSKIILEAKDIHVKV